MSNENALLSTQRCSLNYASTVSINPKAVNRSFSTYFVVSAGDHCFHSHQVLSYEALDKHEIDCGFQPQRCAGCRSEIPKKDLICHESLCGSIELSCQDCQLAYKRQEAATKHSENICLKNQLRDLRRQLTDLQLASEFEAPV